MIDFCEFSYPVDSFIRKLTSSEVSTQTMQHQISTELYNRIPQQLYID